MLTQISHQSLRAARFQGAEAVKRAVFALMSSALLGGCASSVQRGAEFYMQRRYIDAAQVFEHTEPQLSAWEDAERAEYALYRGATFLALGNREEARLWLQGAQTGWVHLSTSDRELLTSSLRAVETGSSPPVFPSARGLAATPVRFSP